MVKLLCAESTASVILGVSLSANQGTCTSQSPPKHGNIILVSGGGFSMGNSNLSRATQTCSSPKNPGQSCGARTRRGTACQKPPLNGKTRCRLHGGLTTGPRTAEGKARIAAAHWKRPLHNSRFSHSGKFCIL